MRPISADGSLQRAKCIPGAFPPYLPREECLACTRDRQNVYYLLDYLEIITFRKIALRIIYKSLVYN